MPKDDFEPLRLIEMVRNRPVLWDKTAECYTRKNKYIYWEQIGKELYSSIWDSLTEEQRKFRSFQLSKKWINLRDCYVRNRRESLTNYSLYGIKKRKYQYSSEMAFLDKSWRLKRSNMNNNNNNNNIKMEKDDTGDTVSFNGEVNLNNHYNGQYMDDNSNENDMMMGYDELRSNNSQYSDIINPVVEISCAVGNDPRSNHLAGVVTFDDGDDIDEDDISLHGSQLSNLSQSMIYHRDPDEDDDDDDPIMDEDGMNMAMNHLPSHHLQSPPLIRNHRPTVRIHNNSKFNSNSNGISPIVPGVTPSSTSSSHNPGTNENTTMSDILQNLMVDCIQKFDNPMVSFMLSLRPAYSSFCNRKISIFQRKIMDILHEVDSLPIEELSSTNSNSTNSITATSTLEASKNQAQNSSPNPAATTNGIDNCSKNKIINCHSKRIRNR